MENEDVILDQMENTRTALTEKLETLETQVASTVQGATANVAGTIEAVKETVEAVKDSVEEAVATVKETVAETVTTAKEAVQDGVSAMKSLVDVPGWVRAYPWPAFGVSVALGFGMERLIVHPAPRGHATSYRQGFQLPPDHVSGESTFEGAQPPHSFWSGVAASFEPEIKRLKALAIGKLMYTIEQLVGDVLPTDMAPKARGVFHDITRKMGGDVLDETSEPAHTSTELA
jgi:hypothetical protein